ncbi:MAG TPA: GNAT family N-acetyltransferase [Actinocrinis sp.]|uniref:GNAT family N-acetyltransferase n=1 Tax=Actinocrinis sp. TaxID=1920516 RepID=UPI002D2A9A98|nr:GNAT family N-acetyltransferase [Actinocrinis sp.]HZU58000.1 GNAT family N-acetyltransferase [Actinocrinis sp.]
MVSGVQREDLPDLPIPSFEAFAERMSVPTARIGPRRAWVARVDGTIVAVVMAYFPPAENKHIGVVNVQVLPHMRRQGIGAALVRAALPSLHADGRHVIASQGMREGSTGDIWARRHGFHPVHRVAVQSLAVNDATNALWQVSAPPEFRSLRWVDSTPDEFVVEYARARTAITDAPTGDQSYTHPTWTVEQVRRHEAAARAIGTKLYVVAAVHEPTGTIAGLTEMEMRVNETDRGHQEDTAVLPAFRGRGLGRYIKAEMMRWLTSEYPALKSVITASAVENSHMIRVNRELGYVTDMVLVDLEADIEDLAARLEP